MNPNETQNNPQNSPSAPYTPVENDHKKIGPIIAILIIVFVLIIAALYLFASKYSKYDERPRNIIPENTAPITKNIEANVNNLPSVKTITNTSDELQDLQNDLNSSTNGLDNQNF